MNGNHPALSTLTASAMNALENEILERLKNDTLLDFLTPKLGTESPPLDGDVNTALTKLHNAGAIDFLHFARKIDSVSTDNYQFFEFQSLFSQVLPQLEATSEYVLLAVDSLLSHQGRNVSATFPFDALRDWCTKDARVYEVLEYVNRHRVQTFFFTTVALQAGALRSLAEFVGKSVQYLKDDSPEVRRAALVAFGAMRFDDNQQLMTEALNGIKLIIDESPDDDSAMQGLRSAIAIHTRAADLTSAAVAEIVMCARTAGGRDVHHEAALSLGRYEALSANVVEGLLLLCRDVDPTDTSTICTIDFAASRLLSRNLFQQSIELVSFLLKKDPEAVTMKLFDDFARGIIHGETNRFRNLVLDWLLSNSYPLQEAAAELFTYTQRTPPVFDCTEPLNRALKPGESVFLARKIIGYLFLRPVTAASLLICLLRTCQEEERNRIADLLFDPLLINYSGSTAEYLRKIRDNEADAIRSSIDTALKRLDDYLTQIKAVDDIKELAPSERERFIERHHRELEMRDLYKIAEERSVINVLAARSVILYGASSINHVTDPSGAQRRSELKLHRIGESTEVPRMLIVDPSGLDRLLHQFRTEQRTS